MLDDIVRIVWPTVAMTLGCRRLTSLVKLSDKTPPKEHEVTQFGVKESILPPCTIQDPEDTT